MILRKAPAIKKAGEFELIARLESLLSIDSPDILVGPGDDAAVIRVDERRAWLATCDIQIENVHFTLDYATPYQAGYRAAAVNLSDIAAMGGRPSFALLSLGLPRDLPVEDFEGLIRGVRDQLSQYGAFLIGGNMARAESGVLIDLFLVGQIGASQFIPRSGAQPGDVIYISGTIGTSAAGRLVLQKYGRKFPQDYEGLVRAHRRPIPRIDLGAQLAEQGLATAMIDISDGLAADLHHLCQASGAGARISPKSCHYSSIILFNTNSSMPLLSIWRSTAARTMNSCSRRHPICHLARCNGWRRRAVLPFGKSAALFPSPKKLFW